MNYIYKSIYNQIAKEIDAEVFYYIFEEDIKLYLLDNSKIANLYNSYYNCHYYDNALKMTNISQIVIDNIKYNHNIIIQELRYNYIKNTIKQYFFNRKIQKFKKDLVDLLD